MQLFPVRSRPDLHQLHFWYQCCELFKILGQSDVSIEVFDHLKDRLSMIWLLYLICGLHWGKMKGERVVIC